MACHRGRHHAPARRGCEPTEATLSHDLPTSDTILAPTVFVAPSPGRGRGVFAARRFEPGDIIEICPVIPLSQGDARKLDDTALRDYYFGWGKDRAEAGIVLGYGSLYNHAFAPNAEHRKHVDDGIMSVIAVRPIAVGEEIFIRYETGRNDDPQALWFAVR